MPNNRICEITEGHESIDVDRMRKCDNVNVDNKVKRRKRARTQLDKTKTNLEKFRMLPACEASRSRKCKFTEDNRLAINQKLWKLTFGERHHWMQTFVEEVEVAQRKTKRKQNYRTHSIQYDLPREHHIGLKTRVCKTMCLSTLGLKTDSMVTELLKSKRKSFDESISPNIDRRGKNLRPCPHKVDHEIRQNINSYNPSISHYSWENAPNRRYLNPDITVKQMWMDFAKKNPAGGGYQIYFNVF